MLSARRAIVRALTCTFATFAAASAGAQPPAPLPASLTIDAAVREAIDHNLSVVAERYSVSAARARVLTARLRPNPVMTLNAMLPDSTVYHENISPIEQVVRTDVILERGGKRERRIDVAEAAASVAELHLLNTIRTLVLDVEGAFVDVRLAKDNLALARQSRDAFDALVRINTERVRTGDLSQVELARSRLAALQFQNDVRQQEARLAAASTHLRALLGRRSDDPIDVAGDLRRDDTPVDLDAIRAEAIRQRPDLEALRRDQARSAADVRLQIAQGTVDYTVSGEFHHQTQSTPPGANAGNLYGVYFSVPIPIFNRNQGEIVRAREEMREADAKVRALESDISHEVRTAVDAYAAARDVITTIETDMLAQARDVRATTEYSYRRGEASFIEFLDAVRAFNDTMQGYNQARADYARSLYQLDAVAARPAAGAGASTVTP